jgi:Phage integrase, N-terminal SAM-like domain
VEFLAANIRNANTRRAYARACQQFFAWCDERGLTLTTIRPVDVARYIETRQQTHSAPDVKQQLAAVRICSIGSSLARDCAIESRRGRAQCDGAYRRSNVPVRRLSHDPRAVAAGIHAPIGNHTKGPCD